MDLARLGDIMLDSKYQRIRQLAAGDPATDSSILPTDGSCPWNRVPRELRDEIFRYAYGRRAGGLKILFKVQSYSKWDKSTCMSSRNRIRVSTV